MEQHLIYVRLKPFLRQWVEHAFGRPVRFPARSPENAFLRHVVRLRPKGTRQETDTTDLTPIMLPDQSDHPVRCWNYIADTDKKVLCQMIDDLFTLAWRSDLYPALSRPGIGETVRRWCRANGIDIDHEGTVIQRINRWRRECRKNGINLFYKVKNN